LSVDIRTAIFKGISTLWGSLYKKIKSIADTIIERYIWVNREDIPYALFEDQSKILNENN